MNVHDLVCGREMDLGDAVAFENHDGWAYCFCSAECHEAFRTMPERFTNKPDTASGSRATRPTRSSRMTT